MRGSVYWIALAILLASVYGSFVAWRRAQRHNEAPAPLVQRISDGPPLQDFVLTDQSGKAFDSAELRGKVWVGSFFFTNCPGSCWRMNQALAALESTRPDISAQLVSITCDPANDTPEALARYAEHFHANPARWTFLTGDMDLIRRIGNDFFRVPVEPATHSDRAFVIDRQGQVRGNFRLTEPDQLKHLERLLAVVEAEAPVTEPAGEPSS